MCLAETLEYFVHWRLRGKCARREFQHGSCDRAWTDRVHPYAVGRVIECQSTGQTENRSFRCHIGRDATLAGMSLDRRDIHNRSAAALSHLRHAETREKKYARNINRKAAIPAFEVCLQHSAIRMNCGGIYQDVDTGER